jgi:carbamoyltransferase
MNTRLLREAGFEHIFIQPAASDAGNSLGAALWIWHHQLGRPRTGNGAMAHAFWGPEYGERECATALEGHGLAVRRVADPADEAARLLAESRVVGWFQGRAEIGPRALGARSILADPRRSETKDIVNARVKRREGFRPFAPSVLDEHGAAYFEAYYPNPFMLLVQPVRAEQRDSIPAVTHVDGTARLQTVTAAGNPDYHRLIDRFAARTGVPVVLNTSFNLRGEPIVHTPAEAVTDFLRSGMDALVLGPFLVERT